LPASHRLAATALQVLTTPDPGHFRTRPVESLAVDLQGIPGDRHYGFTRPAGARERWYKGGTQIRSGRQLTIVSVEDLAVIAANMDLPAIDPAWIGANVLIQGIPDFTLLPWGSRIFFGEGAVLVNEGDNVPCRFAGAAIAQNYPERMGLDMLFVKAAQDRRGIVATVERAGQLAPGPVTVKIPQQKTWTGGTLL
jgi:MOSC domain-containing protein YiiM